MGGSVAVGAGSVLVGGGGRVSVGGGSVGVAGGGRVSVGGGSGVSVAVGRGVLVGGGGTVRVAVGPGPIWPAGRGRRVEVGAVGVAGAGRVDVSEGKTKGIGKVVSVGKTVGVETNAVTTCCVRAAEVLRLATASPTIFNGSTPVCAWLFRSFMAMPETLHSRQNPTAPAARIPRGPVYSLARTLFLLL